MSILDNVTPTPTRGVVRIDPDCTVCGAPVPVFGAVGKGRPLDLFRADYFCTGHAIHVMRDAVKWR